MDDESRSRRRRIRWYTALIAALVFVPIVLGFCASYAGHKLANKALNMSKEQKLHLIETAGWKESGVTTVEEFDRQWREAAQRPGISWTGLGHLLVELMLFIGLFLFCKWAVYGTLVYSVYSIACVFMTLPGLETIGAHKVGLLIGKSFRLAVFVVCLVYYSRKAVRHAFGCDRHTS